MRFLLINILVLACLSYQSYGTEISRRVFNSVEFLHNLHREPPPPTRSQFNKRAITEDYFTAPLDNFNVSETRTWRMV